MTEEELKAEAASNGYRICKIPAYQCSCYMPYPNENHKNRNGSWKCNDKYEQIKFKQSSKYGPITKCKRK